MRTLEEQLHKQRIDIADKDQQLRDKDQLVRDKDQQLRGQCEELAQWQAVIEQLTPAPPPPCAAAGSSTPASSRVKVEWPILCKRESESGVAHPLRTRLSPTSHSWATVEYRAGDA